jgi:hypothetical protein
MKSIAVDNQSNEGICRKASWSGQNTTEYRSDRRYSGVGGWVAEIITSIRRYLWQHEYGRGPLFILCMLLMIR